VKKAFSTTGGPVGPRYAEGINPTVAIAIGAGISIGTFFLLDKAFNHVSASSKSFISSPAHEYLGKTYAYVAAALGSTAAGAIMAFRAGFAHRMMTMNPWLLLGGSLLVTGGGLVLTMMTPPENSLAKHGLFLFTTGSLGAASLSTLGFFPQALLVRAGLYTLGIVFSLSAVAINARSDTFLYMGGPLFIGLNVVVLASLARMFFPVGGAAFTLVSNVSLYGGLGVFSLFMLFDTQRALENGRQLALSPHQKPDYINESIGIYLNIINIFVRMVEILAMNQNKKR